MKSKPEHFVVLCNMRASRRSKWVKQEMEGDKQVTKTVVVTNLERDSQTELHKVSESEQLKAGEDQQWQ